MVIFSYIKADTTFLIIQLLNITRTSSTPFFGDPMALTTTINRYPALLMALVLFGHPVCLLHVTDLDFAQKSALEKGVILFFCVL